MIKYNEAQAVKKTYEQIVKRLQEERLTFDNQLSNFEKTLKVKKSDALELESMSRDATHAKELAKVKMWVMYRLSFPNSNNKSMKNAKFVVTPLLYF